ncbi:uncharacterized protein LOC120075190 [Benincasa hispida]|uniref:uncharacterized protein LOC120075190 n=1 Tax=Benincasa hispida TaxID=102211 RepID=UPI00190196E0|nr:uncharacterized protein LOC120075190 [Benincasa hispida]
MAMSMATTCCLNNLNPPPQLPQNSTTSVNNQLVPWNGNGEWWQKRRVLVVAGVATALIMAGESGGVEMGNVNIVDSRKWSEERMCPQWRLNSLETVVPENLPRPTGRRRWDPAALPHTAPAPQLRTTHTTSLSTRCFSL